MELKTFYDNFELLAEAPNGIQKLREMTLQLAVQGKLVPRVEQDGTGKNVLEKNREKRDQLIKSGAIKKPKKLPPIDNDECQFILPEHWTWARLGDVTNYGYSDKVLPVNLKKSLWILELEDIEKITSRLLKIVRIKDRESKSSKNVFKSGDVIYGKLRPYLDKVVIASEDGVCTTEMIPIRGYYGIVPKYLRWVLKSPFFIAYANRSTHGMNLPRMGTDKARLALIPIPPMEEQKRIAAKIDELMALCDDLEARQQNVHHTCIKLNDASINKLVNASTSDKLKKHWNRIHTNFNLLYRKPENIDKLRKAILQLAVQGRLVPQDANDEPASVLLERVHSEQNLLVKSKEIKKLKSTLPIKDTEKPYIIPESWVWVRLENIRRTVEYGTSSKASKENIGVPILRMNNIQNGQIVLDKIKFVSKKIKDLPRLYLKNNDILFNRTNSYELVGKAGLFQGDDDSYTFASYLIRVSLINSYVDPAYIVNAMNSQYFRVTQIEPEITQQCGQANFNGTKLSNVIIPIPPLKEQKRIVRKIDELMSLCDIIENKLKEGQSKSKRIIEAVVSDLLAA